MMIVDGNGTEEKPYRLLGDNDTNLSGVLISNRYSGEYIAFGTGENSLYRIVSHEMRGLTKITSAEPLKENGTFKITSFGSNSTYSHSNTIGTFLNGEYLTSYVGNDYANMIENSTVWYLGTVGDGDSYKLAKYTNIIDNIVTLNTVVTKVGLLRYGELMTGHFQRNLTKGDALDTNWTNYYWLLTPYNTTNVHYINPYGYNNHEFLNSAGIKPALNLKSNVIITSGDGTKQNPFQIALDE